VLRVTYGRGLVLWWRSDTFCTSGFMDDIISAHTPRLLDVAAQMKCSSHAAFGLNSNNVYYFWQPKAGLSLAINGVQATDAWDYFLQLD